MPVVNFLDPDYRCEPLKSDVLLGICDPGGENCAYTSVDEQERWDARIENFAGKFLQFVPIDKNFIVRRPDGDQDSTCDGMLLYDDDKSICFVELKNVRVRGWMQQAIGQLENTIQIFNENHDYTEFSNREAYVANSRHPHFDYSHKDKLQEFRKRTHFRLMPQDNIVIR